MKRPFTLDARLLTRLRLLERVLLPLPDYSAVSLFSHLGRPAVQGDDDPAWQFTQLIAEEGQRLPPGSRVAADFEGRYPGSRAEAQLTAQELGRRTHPVAQFLAFVPAVCRYLQPGRSRPFIPTASVRLWADALTPDREERAALGLAQRRQWLTAAQVQRALSLEHRIAALPGQETESAEAVPEILACYCRRQAERYVSAAGPQPARAEIFVDVSSATADPLTTASPLTLTALVAATAVIRAGGSVRLHLFADTHIQLNVWSRSERAAALFLLHYLGGGSVFPVAALAKASGQRIIIADGACDLTAAVRAAPESILLLHAAERHRVAQYRAVGARVTNVADLNRLPAQAACWWRPTAVGA